MSAMKTVAEMTVEELKELIRQVVAEQREYFLDEDGWLVFTSEEAYARYLERHPDKMPSELKACFIDEHGIKAYYSDYELTEEGLKRLEEARKDIEAGRIYTWDEIKRELESGRSHTKSSSRTVHAKTSKASRKKTVKTS
ncbi:MAG: hypothetical protein N3B10_01140 [Armatimonadetes bacterium]|nr:hypothetical protein [Armatimonadota bacterium]MCX7967073.1 hypothetical protein [Armatimonadota bacterium]MDW8143690.1 hypothetical protein [Armatimonadota bacterium]